MANTLTNNQADYCCPYCDSVRLTFVEIGLLGRLTFNCKDCGKNFETEDREGKYLHPKVESLIERYPA